jgi:hypothetical protein
MVYIDKPLKWNVKSKVKWSHLVADNVEELHRFAESMGIKRSWFSNKRGRYQPHYDLNEFQYEEALKRGAIEISSKELVVF